jgi:hypothetical protein
MKKKKDIPGKVHHVKRGGKTYKVESKKTTKRRYAGRDDLKDHHRETTVTGPKGRKRTTTKKVSTSRRYTGIPGKAPKTATKERSRTGVTPGGREYKHTKSTTRPGLKKGTPQKMESTKVRTSRKKNARVHSKLTDTTGGKKDVFSRTSYAGAGKKKWHAKSHDTPSNYSPRKITKPLKKKTASKKKTVRKKK